MTNAALPSAKQSMPRYGGKVTWGRITERVSVDPQLVDIDLIDRTRRRLGWSLLTLSKVSGVADSALRNLMKRGAYHGHPTVGVILLVAQALDLTIDDVVERPKVRRKKTNVPRNAAIIEARRQGTSWRALSDDFEISQTRIRQICRKAGLKA